MPKYQRYQLIKRETPLQRAVKKLARAMLKALAALIILAAGLTALFFVGRHVGQTIVSPDLIKAQLLARPDPEIEIQATAQAGALTVEVHSREPFFFKLFYNDLLELKGYSTATSDGRHAYSVVYRPVQERLGKNRLRIVARANYNTRIYKEQHFEVLVTNADVRIYPPEP